jgi:PAS domain S-box-containing protein
MGNPEKSSRLRQRAEEAVREKEIQSPENLDAVSIEETRQTLHELRVHQVELEMQNEELRRAQVELDATRARYFDLYDLAPVGYLILSDNGQVFEANLTAAKLLGVARGAIIQQTINRFIIKEDQDNCYRHLNILFKTGEPQACELRMLKTDGTQFWAYLAATAMKDAGGVRVCRVVLSDITELKQAEESLKAGEERLHEVLDNSLDASYKRNIQTNSYDYLSPVFSRISGYAPDEMKTLPIETVLALMHPDDLTDIERVIAESMDGTAGIAYQLEYRFKHKDGQYRWFRDRFTVMRDAQGKPLARIGSVSDITERKRIEAVVRESERRFAAMADGAPVLIWTSGTNKLCNYFNKVWIDFTGRTMEQEMGNGWTQGIYPDDLARCLETYVDSFDARQSFCMEYRLRRHDGQYRWILDNGVPRYHAEGDFAGYIGSCIDITQRKQLEDDLRESEEKYRIIFNNEIYAICIFDLETLKLLDVNGAFTRLYGYHREELLSRMTIHDITVEHEISDASTRQAIRDGTIFIPVRHHRKKDGTVIPVEIVGGPYVWKGKKVMFGLIHDITERKRAEAKIEELNRHFVSFLEHTSDFIYFKDENSRIIFCSQTLADITRHASWRDMIGKHDLEIFPKETAQIYYEEEFPVFNEGRALLNKENTYFDVSGNKGFVSTNKWPLLNPEGKVVGLFGISREITAIKKAEEGREKMESQNRQLQKSESLGRMAGAIAHHFNNQLQVVMMNLHFALRSKSSGEFPTENLTGAMESARKAAEVSTLMLTFLGQTNAKYEPLDFSKACLGSMPMLKATIPKGIVLDTDFPCFGPVINGNADQIQQVMINLVTNAWEASLDGRGAIRLAVKVVSLADIPATNRFPIDCHPEENSYACLEVADEGCGISAQDIEKLFEPFFSSKFTGRGLGLPVVLGIVRAHQGVITVESEQGRGSVFRVFMPVSADDIPQKQVPVVQAQASKTTQSGTVLVVEDEITLRKVVTTAIKGMGFKVLEASDGVQAVEVFRQHQEEIRLVLCDMTMPNMDGWQTIEALRKLEPCISVILCSGYSEAQVMSGKHTELPQEFLSKPYEYEKLSEAVLRVFREEG